MRNKLKACMSTGENNWATPQSLYKELDKEFSFDFDPCPLNSTFDGLAISWGKSNFINPPYSTKEQNAFVRKAYEEYLKGNICVLLLPVRTGSKRWQEVILPFATEIRFIAGRLRFGDATEGAPFDSAIVIFK